MKYALITGATSGIGAQFAWKWAFRGYSLILTGRRKEKIESLAEDIRQETGVKVEVILADFTVPEELERVKNAVNPGIEVLINNAGFSNHCSYFETGYEVHKKLIDVHINASMELMHIAIPHMKEKRKGVIINVSSLAGFYPSLSDPSYCASKAFLNLYSECSGLSLKPWNIRVQALCPGFTRTDFHSKLNIAPEKLKNRGLIRWMMPEKVVDVSLKKLGTNQIIVIPGFFNNLLYRIATMIPKKVYYRIVSRKRAFD